MIVAQDYLTDVSSNAYHLSAECKVKVFFHMIIVVELDLDLWLGRMDGSELRQST